MKYCSHCGKELNDNAVVCVNCGCNVANTHTVIDDAPNTGFAVLGFFIPIAGLILYLVNKDQAPQKAASAGKGALTGFIVGILGSILYGCVIGSMIGSMY